MKSTSKIATFSLFSLSLILFGCGGGGSSGGDAAGTDTPAGQTSTGVFVDAPVGNMQYETDTLVGRTNSNGEFSYRDGETVSFAIADIVLPSVKARSIVTPLAIFDTADIEDIRVLNLARLLQSLDADQDLSNQIMIPENAYPNATGLPLDFASGSFANDVSNLVANSDGADALLSEADALANLKDELLAISDCGVNTYNLAGSDYVFNDVDLGGGDTYLSGSSITSLNGALEVDGQTCSLVDNVEGYSSGNCDIAGDAVTVTYSGGTQVTGTVSGNTFTWSTPVNSEAIDAEETEYVMAHFNGVASGYCAPAAIPAGDYSLSGEETVVSPGLDGNGDLDGTKSFDRYNVAGTLTISAAGECSASTTEGGWGTASCELRGNQILVNGGVYRGTIGPGSVTLLYRSPGATPKDDSYAGYLKGERL